MNSIHVLKTVDRYWDAVKAGTKTFDVRRNDRAFQTGDVLVLRRTDEKGFSATLPEDRTSRFSESDLTVKVSYLLQGGQFGIEPGYCVLGLVPMVESQGSKEKGAKQLKEWQKHIRDTRRHEAEIALCGADIAGQWAFVDVEHAFASLAEMLQPCPKCAAQVIKAFSEAE